MCVREPLQMYSYRREGLYTPRIYVAHSVSAIRQGYTSTSTHAMKFENDRMFSSNVQFECDGCVHMHGDAWTAGGYLQTPVSLDRWDGWMTYGREPLRIRLAAFASCPGCQRGNVVCGVCQARLKIETRRHVNVASFLPHGNGTACTYYHLYLSCSRTC
jgi:hypothetical protein